MDYEIIEAANRSALKSKVRELIKEGWEPIGGVTVAQQLCDKTKMANDNRSTLYDCGLIYAQAMIKQESGDA